MYKDDTTDCVLLVDAAYALNSLNRSAALQNVGVLCQPRHQYSIPQESILITHKDGCQRNKKTLVSLVGTTQGCNLAMDFYGIGIMKLIHKLKGLIPDCCNSWYADDSAGAGRADAVKRWWEAVKKYGPKIGYFPQPEKTETTDGNHRRKPPTETTEGNHRREPPTETTDGNHRRKPPTETTDGNHRRKPPTETTDGNHRRKPPTETTDRNHRRKPPTEIFV